MDRRQKLIEVSDDTQWLYTNNLLLSKSIQSAADELIES